MDESEVCDACKQNKRKPKSNPSGWWRPGRKREKEFNKKTLK